MVPDLRTCDFLAGSEDLATFLDAGLHAARSSPLVSRTGKLLGMLTTYWRQPHHLSVSELRALDVLARLAADLIERTRAEEALRENQRLLLSIYETVGDVIFDLAVEPDGQFRFVSVNAAFLRVTALSRETVVGRTVSEVIPEPALTMVLGNYRQAIEGKTAVIWEETSEYPSGRLTGEVSVVPIFDDRGTCTHLVGTVHDITERKEMEEKLRTSEQQLQALAGSLLTAQEDERLRISRELHDLTQHLAAMAIELASIAEDFPKLSERLKQRLRVLRARAVETAESSREVAYQVYPSVLDDLGLSTALRASCEDFGRDGITVEFSSRRLPEALDRESTSCLYKVAQEALRNITKHSKSERVWVTLAEIEDRIVLQIRDEGVGFAIDSLGAGGGLGIISMRERVRNLNGSFAIESKPGHGTVITVDVPARRL
jgi:PAS domain S-box-containing protein